MVDADVVVVAVLVLVIVDELWVTDTDAATEEATVIYDTVVAYFQKVTIAVCDDTATH